MALLDVLDYQLHKISRKKRPLALVLAVTDRCSLRCQMCNIWQNKATDLGVPEWQSILTDKLYKKVKTIVVTGGEPMLHAKFVEICEMIVSTLPIRNYVVNTSGIYPQKTESLLAMLANRQIDTTIIISLDGGREIHNKVRGIPTAFDKAMESVKLVNQSKYAKLVFQMTISDQSVQDIKDVQLLAKQYQASANFKVAYNQETLKNGQMTFFINDDVHRYVLDMYQRGMMTRPWWDKAGFQDMTELDQLHGNTRTAPCSFMDRTAVYLAGSGKLYVCQNEPLDARGSMSERVTKLKNTACSSCWNTCLNTAALRSHWLVYLSYLLKRKTTQS